MAKIKLGRNIEQIVKDPDKSLQLRHLNEQLEVAFQKLNSLLLTGKRAVDVTAQHCAELRQKSQTERTAYIAHNWGPAFTVRTDHFLKQIATIENEIHRLK